MRVRGSWSRSRGLASRGSRFRSYGTVTPNSERIGANGRWSGVRVPLAQSLLRLPISKENLWKAKDQSSTSEPRQHDPLRVYQHQPHLNESQTPPARSGRRRRASQPLARGRLAPRRQAGLQAPMLAATLLPSLRACPAQPPCPQTLVPLACAAAYAATASPFCGILLSGSESGTGHSYPLDGSADTFGGWG